MTNEIENIKRDVRRILAENVMLEGGLGEIGDDQPLFGPGSLGLDSIDALQLVVSLDKNYGLKIPDAEAAREILRSINSMASALAAHFSATAEASAVPQR
jgi:acyl carrier protein